MSKRYHCGSREAAVRRMAECAIRDRKTMIAALRPDFGEPDEWMQKQIDECQREIEDFQRIARGTLSVA